VKIAPNLSKPEVLHVASQHAKSFITKGYDLSFHRPDAGPPPVEGLPFLVKNVLFVAALYGPGLAKMRPSRNVNAGLGHLSSFGNNLTSRSII
jgi:hypothetical protein